MSTKACSAARRQRSQGKMRASFRGTRDIVISKDLCFKHTRERRGQASPTNCWCARWSLLKTGSTEVALGETRNLRGRPDMFSLHDVIKPACVGARPIQAKRMIWTVPDSGRAVTPWRAAPSSVQKPAEFEAKRMVEPDGIEPTASCLQSTRSPN